MDGWLEEEKVSFWGLADLQWRTVSFRDFNHPKLGTIILIALDFQGDDSMRDPFGSPIIGGHDSPLSSGHVFTHHPKEVKA